MKLQVGGRKISASGNRGDVESMIEKWWPKLVEHQGRVLDDTPSQRKKSSRSSTTSNKKDELGDDAFDANALANEIKEHERFDVIRTKIINKKGDYYYKVALVLWAANEPLTSGKIHKVLQGLDVKISLPNLSTTLKRHGSNFITSSQRKLGGTPPDYRLTSKAKAEFEIWLES